MSATWDKIFYLIQRGEILVSEHGYDELAAESILVRDVLDSVRGAVVLEDYPDFPKGPCVLVLQINQKGEPVHAVWGIPRGLHSPAVLVTAYRPDPDQWSDDFQRRKK